METTRWELKFLVLNMALSGFNIMYFNDADVWIVTD